MGIDTSIQFDMYSSGLSKDKDLVNVYAGSGRRET